MFDINRLPVMEAMVSLIKKLDVPNLEKIVFVCVQHLLFTSLNLFDSLIQLGAKPDNIFLIGKHYSTSKVVSEKLMRLGIQLQSLTPLKRLGEYTSVFNNDVSKMWKNVQQHILKRDVEAVVVLDDGGRCLEFITQGILAELPVVGIEQTTAGLFNPKVLNLHIPFVDVAACAAKKYLESEMVVDAIINKLSAILPANEKNIPCGVVGAGVIGTAVIKKLIALEYPVILYEQQCKKTIDFNQVICAKNLSELVQKSEYIFGCTGRDITAEFDLEETVRSNKTFISCTSEDKEFLSLLSYIEHQDNNNLTRNPLNNIYFPLKNGASINIYRGGFPVNFDDTGESVPAHNIQLTRGLLLGGVMQAIASLVELQNDQVKGRVMLDPYLQKFVVNEWKKSTHSNSFQETLLRKFNDIDWIIENSGGAFYDSAYFSKYFEPITVTTDIEVVNYATDAS